MTTEVAQPASGKEKRAGIKPLYIFVIAAFILTWNSWSQIITFAGWDPDDQLRMVQLRDFLAGQSWFDVTQYRMNAPAGAPMHWSRMVELPLAAIILMFAPFVGQTTGEMIAGTVVPLLLFGGVAIMLSRIATRLGSAQAGLIAMLVAILTPALMMQMRPMRIDHHGWQIFFSVLALSTMFWSEKRKAGITLGFALACWLHISLEGLPLSAAFFVLLGWLWIVEKAQGERLVWTICSFATFTFLLFGVTQASPFAADVYCDTVSLPHLTAILLASVIMLPAILLKPQQRWVRALTVIIAGAASAAIFAWAAPSCLRGAFGELDPLVREYWYVNINEGLPIWHQEFKLALVFLATPFCGIAAAVVLLRNSGNRDNAEMRMAAFFLVYAAILSLLVMRTVAVASAFAVPTIALWLNHLFSAYRSEVIPAKRIGYVALMLLLLLPGVAADRVGRLTTIFSSTEEAEETSEPDSIAENCESVSSVGALRQLPAGNFIAPFDIGPAILLTTQHRVLASSHHRNKEGMHDQIAFFISDPAKAEQLARGRGITYVATCLGEAEMDLYARKKPDGLWGQIAKGKTPDWLEPMPDMGKGVKVWRVR
jgi:hypothetical protein